MRKGQTVSEETRERMRQAASRRNADPAYRAKLSATHKALNQDPEFYKRRIGAMRASLERPEVQARRLAATQDPERRRKIGESARGRKDSPEVRERKSQARIGMKFSPEHCEHIRQVVSNRSPETIEKIRQARMRQTMPNRMTVLERALYDAFTSLGLSFEINNTLFGRFQPDFVFESVRLAVQADGEYWHQDTGARGSGRMIAKDAKFNAAAEAAGWSVIRFSGQQILANPQACALAVAAFIAAH